MKRLFYLPAILIGGLRWIFCIQRYRRTSQLSWLDSKLVFRTSGGRFFMDNRPIAVSVTALYKN